MQKALNINANNPALTDYQSAARYFSELRNNKHILSEPLVSIITVVKNQQAELALTIESVRAQKYPHIEHLIVNGGQTLNIETSSNCYILTEVDLGISDAFNKGIAGASGEIICILNAGDTYVCDAISNVVIEFKAREDLGILCAAAFFREGDTRIYCRKPSFENLPYFMSVLHPATFVRKEVYSKIGLYRLDFAISMDYEFLLRAQKSKIKFLEIEMELAEVLTNGISDRSWREALFEAVKARRINQYDSLLIKLYESYDLIFQTTYNFLKNRGCVDLIKLYRKYFSTLSYLKND